MPLHLTASFRFGEHAAGVEPTCKDSSPCMAAWLVQSPESTELVAVGLIVVPSSCLGPYLLARALFPCPIRHDPSTWALLLAAALYFLLNGIQDACEVDQILNP